MVTREQVLAVLPPYRDEWVKITGSQTVRDIVGEVVEAHKEFAPFYNRIAPLFAGKDVRGTCDELYRFCKKNIAYHEESEDRQTTAVPAGVLTRGYGDCKHYAGFIGGVLDALGRVTGSPIDWCYRFASYKVLRTEPHHVFVVVRDKLGNEYWVDPTPGSNGKEPVWYTDKKMKNMALYRNIGAVGLDENPAYAEALNVDTDSLVVFHYEGKWYAYDKYGPIDINQFGYQLSAAHIGLTSDASGAISATAGMAANLIAPGSGALVTTGLNALLSLFKGKDQPAQTKIFQMFPLSTTNPTAQEVAMQINAILQHALSGSPADYTKWDANWKDAFNQILTKYTQIYNGLMGTNYPVPQSYPPISGYVFPPATGTGSGTGTGTGTSTGKMVDIGQWISQNKLLVAGIGIGLFFLIKNLAGSTKRRLRRA